MNRNTGMSAGQIIGTMKGLQVMGLDIAKHVFQLHTVDMGTGEIANVQIKRAKVLEYFVNKPHSLIAMEACGGAHHWARELTALGHSVRLLHAKIVRPFVSGNNTAGLQVWRNVKFAFANVFEGKPLCLTVTICTKTEITPTRILT